MNTNIIVLAPNFIIGGESGPVLLIEDNTPWIDYFQLSQVKGVFKLMLGSSVIYNNTNFASPDIDPDNSITEKEITGLPVDANGRLVNGAYVLTYKVQITDENVGDSPQVDAPGASPFSQIQLSSPTPTLISAINSYLTNPNYSNVEVVFYDNGGEITRSALLGCNNSGLISFAEATTGDFANIQYVEFHATTINTLTETYNYCDKPATIKLNATSDCLRAQVTAEDLTDYPLSATINSRLLTIQYPRLANGTPVQSTFTTDQSSGTIGPNIWSGNYTISQQTEFTYTETNFTVTETATGFVELNVNCKASMCGLSSCISSLTAQYKKALKEGSASVQSLFIQCFQVQNYVMNYNIAIQCGDSAKANSILVELSDYLEQESGCDCGCSDSQTQSQPTVIYPAFTA